MEKVDMEMLSLITFDKENKDHVIFLRKLLGGKTISERFGGILPSLNSRHPDGILGKFFLLKMAVIGWICRYWSI